MSDIKTLYHLWGGKEKEGGITTLPEMKIKNTSLAILRNIKM